MPTPPLTDEILQETVRVFLAKNRNQTQTADALGIDRRTMPHRLKRAAERGFFLSDVPPPAMPSFRISQVTDSPHGRFIQQKPEHGEQFEVPAGHLIKGVSALVDQSGNEILKWVKTREDAGAQQAAMEAVVAAFASELHRAEPVVAPDPKNNDLLNQYTITDLHFGMLSWREETGADYDLKIAEQLLLDWFSQAIRLSPDAHTAVLAQLGDLLHYDSHESVTPTSRHVLDSDSRFQKMIRVAIRTMRHVVQWLLQKHQRVIIIMCDDNHAPASSAWLREMFSVVFENEPRVTVDCSADTYYVVEWGETSLFYHHGHKRKIADVDSVFAGKFRDTYGRTKFSYAHIGHLHSDELKSTNLMKVERHETLAAPDAYAAKGGWLSGRSAKVITYSKRFGEVGRITLTPEMVARAA